MRNLAMGANATLAESQFSLDIRLPAELSIDVNALQLYADGKVRGDGDMCFFNQPSIASGAISLTTNDNMQSFSIDLDKINQDVEKIVINATLDSGQFGNVSDLHIATSCDIDMLVETSDRTEAALILCEIYKRNNQWKIRNVSQGFSGGLQALVENFGIEVAAPVNSASASSPAASGSMSDSTSAPTSTPASAPTSAPTSAPASAPASAQPPASGSAPASAANSVSSSAAPSIFNRLKQTAEQARSKLATEASRFKNRSFMEAVVNGCVLVAAADGSIDASEKQKMAGFIERSDELKHFDMREVIDVFQTAATAIESDQMLGKVCALEKIRKVKAHEDQARLLVRVVSAIGAADGDFDTQERDMVIEIISELGLDRAEFNI